jgi:hypothetical protein
VGFGRIAKRLFVVASRVRHSRTNSMNTRSLGDT